MRFTWKRRENHAMNFIKSHHFYLRLSLFCESAPHSQKLDSQNSSRRTTWISQNRQCPFPLLQKRERVSNVRLVQTRVYQPTKGRERACNFQGHATSNFHTAFTEGKMIAGNAWAIIAGKATPNKFPVSRPLFHTSGMREGGPFPLSIISGSIKTNS